MQGPLLSLLLAQLLSFQLGAQPIIRGFSPDIAPVGAEVLLEVDDLPPQALLSLTVPPGISAPISGQNADGIRFTIPPGATSGQVLLLVDSVEYRPPFPLRVAREVNVTLSPTAITSLDGYRIGSLHGDALTGPPFAVTVAVGEPTLIAATHPDEDRVQLIAFVLDDQPAVELSAGSSILALLLTLPGIHSTDPQEFALSHSTLLTLPAVQQAMALAAADLVAGIDFLRDERIDTLLLQAIEDFPAARAEAKRSFPTDETHTTGKARDDYVAEPRPLAPGYPRDIPGPVNNLVVKNLPPGQNERGLPVHAFAFEGRAVGPTRINPLDWSSSLWRLDPAEFPNGLPDVNALTNAQLENRVYTRTTTVPISTLVTKSDNIFKKFDLIGLVGDLLIGLLPDFIPKAGLEVPADQSGVYLVRSYSGAIYGPQANILGQLPEGHSEDIQMKAVNIVLAVVEALSVVAPLKTLLGSEVLAKLSYKAAREAAAAMTRQLEAESGLTTRFVRELFRDVGKGLTKDILKQVASRGAGAIGGLAKTFFKSFDLLGKAASAGTAIERIAALTNATQLISENAWVSAAMEGAAVVVGNPWAPEINSFEPRYAHRGSLVVLRGDRFETATPSANIVRFGNQGTDPENPAGAARVIAATRHQLLVEVPESAITGPISVALAGKGSFSTAILDPPNRNFRVLDDPVILAIDPPNPPIGGLMRVVGMNFSPDRDLNQLIYTEPVGTLSHPMSATETALLVRVPTVAGSNSLTVRIGRRTSNALPFSVIQPTISPGASITITSLNDNIAPDGDITLREAILLAKGQLGRPLTEPPEERPPGVTYESDFVAGTPGANFRDTIMLKTGLTGIITLTSSLPDFGSHDVYQLRELTIARGAAGPDAPAFTGTGLRIEGATFTGFTGHGFRFLGSASGNALINIGLVGSGGDGILLTDEATNNEIFDPRISGFAGAGIRFSGPAVRFNRLTRNKVGHPPNNDQIGWFDDGESWGIVVESGAAYNLIEAPHVRRNSAGGIWVRADAPDNLIGRQDGSVGNFSQIFNNSGPGVLIEAPRTVIRYLNVAGNSGPGILLEGPGVTDCVVDQVRVGYESITGLARPNLGSGIHIRGGARNILIGRKAMASFGARTSIGGNRDWGILVEGQGSAPTHVEVRHSHVGYVMQLANTEVSAPNGLGGIALMNASECSIGNIEFALDVHINNHVGGPGILLSGSGTTRNRIVGCQVGSHHDGRAGIGNRIGIQITGGAWGNLIGERGGRFGAFDPDSGVAVDAQPGNVIMANTEAGILLESGGDPTQTLTPGVSPRGGNVIIGNRIGGPSDFGDVHQPNEVGLLIRPGGRGNRIGGLNPGEANLFARNRSAGIQIQGGAVGPNTGHRLIGNDFLEQGFGETPGADPAVARLLGIGVLVTDGASGHLIGGFNPGEGNRFHGNIVGVMIEDSESITVASNQFGDGHPGNGNRLAGAVLLNSTRCCLGPHNNFIGNGTESGSHGAVLLAGGGFHEVLANLIGTDAPTADTKGNDPHGITIIDSTENRIGDLNAGNTILNSASHAVVLKGVASTNNQLAANRIGVADATLTRRGPNNGDGVRIEQGARNNLIGGTVSRIVAGARFDVPAGNLIIGNMGDGVAVLGAATSANSITYNSISDHPEGVGARGIALRSGGNESIPPPLITNIQSGRVSGEVAETVPDGSIIQLFADPGDEGLVQIGEDALVVAGKWEIFPAIVPWNSIRATVTHATTGSTSEFGPIRHLEPSLEIRRRGSQIPAERLITPTTQPTVLLAFELRTDIAPVLIQRILFEIPGMATLIPSDVRLIFDADGDGEWSPVDRLIAEADLVSGSQIRFDAIEETLPPASRNTWLLVGQLPPTPFGESFEVELRAPAAIEAFVWYPSAPLTPQGPFPISGDALTLSEPVSEGWMLR
jgi:hypothetical protein